MACVRVWTRAALLLACLLLQAVPGRATKSPSTSPARTGTQASDDNAPKLDLEGPEAEAKDRARVLFQQGVAAYRDGKFYEAVAIFLQTQRIYPDTQLCFNIARAYENLSNGSAALRYYRDYLRQADRPSDGDEVREHVRRLEQQLSERGVQQLTVLSQPESATVLLDGKPVGITPWTGETYPGKHRLGLTLDGYSTQERIVEVDAYQAHDESMVLIPIPRESPARPTPQRSNEPAATGVSLRTLLTLGSGLVLLTSAIAAEAASDQPGLTRPAAFLAGSGLGVAGVGSVLLYFDLSPHQASSAPLGRHDSAAARAWP